MSFAGGLSAVGLLSPFHLALERRLEGIFARYTETLFDLGDPLSYTFDAGKIYRFARPDRLYCLNHSAHL